MARDYIRPQNNIPVRLVLASMGVIKDGMYGPQKLFHLADGRSVYLDLDIAQRIENAVTVGQEFWLCKRKPASTGQKARWDIYLEDPTPRPGESGLERDLRLSIEEAVRKHSKTEVLEFKPAVDNREEPNVEAPQPPANPVPVPTAEVVRKAPGWALSLVNHTNELVDAYAECLNHASHHGVSVRSDDVRTLLITAFINLSQRNGRKGAA